MSDGSLFKISQGHGPEVYDVTHALSKTTDPATSHKAGFEIVPHLGALQVWAASCVRESPGLTAMELARKYCPLDPRRIGRRLRECERLGTIRPGMARRCSITNKAALTWWTKDDE